MGFRNPITTAIDPVARSMAANPLAQIPDGALPGSKLAADAIDGRTITGALLRTAHTGTQDWVESGALPVELRNAGYTGGSVFYNGHWVGAGAEVRYIALVPSSIGSGEDHLKIVGCDTQDGAFADLFTLADFDFAGQRSAATGVTLYQPRAADLQETLPNSLVRYDYIAPQWVEFTGPANGVTNGALANLPVMTRARSGGATIGLPATGAITLPAGLWLVTWDVVLSGGTINGRSFLQAVSGGTTLARSPLYDPGEDTTSGTFWLPLTASAAVTFQFFFTATASPFNTTHTLRLARVGNAA